VFNPVGFVTVLDVNGDGKLDLAASTASVVSTLALLLGNGDGTFQAPISYPNLGGLALASGDFNGDHTPDLILTQGGTGVTVVLNSGGTFPATTSSQNPSKFGQPVTFTTTVTPTFSFIRTPSGTVTFKDGNKILGKVTLSGGKASLTTSGLSVGKHKILTSYSGDSTFNPNQAPVLKQKVIR